MVHNMSRKIILNVKFFSLSSGSEPVKDWLKDDLSKENRKKIGEDIKAIQFGWPLDVSDKICKKIDDNLWEVRTKLTNRISRVIFTIVDSEMILLHGFIKKSNKIESNDLKKAKNRLSQITDRQKSKKTKRGK